MNQAIDPSEILTRNEGNCQQTEAPPDPWLRLLARFFDYSLFLLAIYGIKALWHHSSSLRQSDSLVPLEFFLWIPVEAFLLSKLGTTPGKWFLKIKLSHGRRGRRMEFATAIRRSFNVWLRGLGMMIPIVNAICLLVAYYRFKTFQITSWDRDERTIISHAQIGRWRTIFAACITIAVFLGYFKG